MRASVRLAACVWLAAAHLAVANQSGAGPAEVAPRELYQALNALRVSPQVYYVKSLNLRRDAVRLSLVEGKLAFLGAYDGRITGAVFSGQGRILALPRDPIEKRSLAHFLGAPLLDQSFSRAYLRFTDQTAEELLQQLRESGALPAEDPDFAEDWNPAIANLNPAHSMRILTERLSAAPRSYFYAGLLSDTSGAFDVLIDDRRAEQVLLGQPRWVQGERYYDVWASLRRADAPSAAGASFQPVTYSIETTIQPDRALDGTALLTLRVARGSERVVPLELSRFLSVQFAEDDERRPLIFFQNEALNRHEIAQRGNDALLVVLPAAPRAGEEIRLRIGYRGGVISDVGNGVYFVGERGSWYPHTVGTASFAKFDLTFHWPRRLQLVATGKKLEQREEGETRAGHWVSEVPIAVAGFNLGDYATESVEAGDVRVDLFANRQLEQAILQRFPSALPPAVLPTGRPRPPYPGPALSPIMEPPPSPAAALRQLGADIADAVRFLERYNGPFPYGRLEVSQIPGTFGQGWPGLLYLSTLSFLTPGAQQRAGISERVQEHFTEIVPYHEVAHQWWGNLVSWDSYRDQWIDEGLANYIALLYADTRKNPEHTLAAWLERYRRSLASKQPNADFTADDAGPLVLGYRLRSSRSPDAFARVIYGKGTWVFHMLRMMLREPSAGGSASPADARFMRLLRTLLEEHRYGALGTEDLKRAVEKEMTPGMALEGGHSMDWFFDQWVHSTGIPRYSVKFTTRPHAGNYLIRGTLTQTGVPDTFLASVPLYAMRTGSKPLPLGTVVTSGPETSFQFVSRVQPKKILIDPQLTLLCLTQ